MVLERMGWAQKGRRAMKNPSTCFEKREFG